MGPWDAAVVIAKAVTYAATLGAAGAVLFLGYAGMLIRPADAKAIHRLIGRLLALSLSASAVRILALSGSMSGDVAGVFDPGLNRMVLESSEGSALLVRLVGLGLMAYAHGTRCRPPARAVLGAFLAATSFAWVGHTHAAAPVWSASVVLALHLSAAAFWVGALFPLLIVAGDADAATIAASAARFGAAALIVVGLLLAAGICLLCVLLSVPAELWSSRYGRFILLKVAVVGCLLAVAAYNRFRLTPRLRALDPTSVIELRRSIRVEIGLVAVILAVTAALTTLAGPAPPP